MLNEEVAILKGEKQETESQEEEQERPLIDVATHIDDSYVEDTDLKLKFIVRSTKSTLMKVYNLYVKKSKTDLVKLQILWKSICTKNGSKN